MINHLLIITLLTMATAISTVFWVFRKKQQQRLTQLIDSLNTMDCDDSHIPEIPTDLPPPVYRYLSLALPRHGKIITKVMLEQQGRIRTSTDSQYWMTFMAQQVIAPLTNGFVWDARLKLPKLLQMAHIQVVDSYVNGSASGAVNLWSAFSVVAAVDEPELNAGALHRYLAEAVWYPAALLPQFGVSWAAIDDRKALATLTDHGITVSLEFRFNEANEVVSVFTPARFGRFDGVYKQVAWEAHITDYQRHQGFLLPNHAEVGWYDKGKLQLVWQGTVGSVVIQTA